MSDEREIGPMEREAVRLAAGQRDPGVLVEVARAVDGLRADLNKARSNANIRLNAVERDLSALRADVNMILSHIGEDLDTAAPGGASGEASPLPVEHAQLSTTIEEIKRLKSEIAIERAETAKFRDEARRQRSLVAEAQAQRDKAIKDWMMICKKRRGDEST